MMRDTSLSTPWILPVMSFSRNLAEAGAAVEVVEMVVVVVEAAAVEAAAVEAAARTAGAAMTLASLLPPSRALPA